MAGVEEGLVRQAEYLLPQGGNLPVEIGPRSRAPDGAGEERVPGEGQTADDQRGSARSKAIV